LGVTKGQEEGHDDEGEGDLIGWAVT
jgi:hypothetical protein